MSTLRQGKRSLERGDSYRLRRGSVEDALEFLTNPSRLDAESHIRLLGLDESGDEGFVSREVVHRHGLEESFMGFFDLDVAPRLPVDVESRRAKVERLIRDSRWITERGDDWDGEGSEGQTEETWKRATDFLRRFLEAARVTLPLPTIGPADEGSIDMFWRLSDRDLLINVPKGEGDRFTYFGEDERGNTVGGHIDPRSTRRDLTRWLERDG